MNVLRSDKRVEVSKTHKYTNTQTHKHINTHTITVERANQMIAKHEKNVEQSTVNERQMNGGWWKACNWWNVFICSVTKYELKILNNKIICDNSQKT